MGPENIVEIEFYLHGETDAAFYVSDTGERQNAQWFPKSKCEAFEHLARSRIEISMEEWIAAERGWI